MKRINSILIAAALIISISALHACKSEAPDEEPPAPTANTELEKTKSELEDIKKDSNRLDAYITDLKNELNALKIENQKLIAQSKRLEAEIIDLKLELGEIPSDDSADSLGKDETQNTGSGQTTDAPEGGSGGAGDSGALQK
jgi:peptidoglycan hydrolase CwlO-like protein